MKLSTKYFLSSIFIFLFVFCNSTFAAQTDIYGGVISQDTTWTKDGSPYVIYAPTDVIIGESTSTNENTGEIITEPIYAPSEPSFTVSAGTTLTIEAGTIVKFDYGESVSVLGNLIANGTSDEKVYFTSLYDDATGGDTDGDDGIINPYNDDWNKWTGIQVTEGGSTELNNSVISYADTAIFLDSSSGQIDNTDITNCHDGVIINSGRLDIKNSNIKDLDGDGLTAVFDSILNIENSNIENISGDLLFLYSNSTSTIKSTTINNVSGNGFYINQNSNLDIRDSDLENISGTTINAYQNISVNILRSTIKNAGGGIDIAQDSTFTLQDSDIENISGRFVEVFNNTPVTINNSTINNIGSGIEAYNNSNVDIENSTITNILDGGWAAFPIFNDSDLNVKNSNIENVFANSVIEIFNGGNLIFSSSTLKNSLNPSDYKSYGAIEAFTGSGNGYASTTVTIAGSTISGGDSIGLEIFEMVNANITNSKITDFVGDGIQVFSYPIVHIADSEISGNNIGIVSWGANVEIKNSIISGNTNFGITNNPAESGAPSILAINNWWGDKSGPFNADTNASGTANSVTSNVEFSPWLTDLPGTKPKCCSNVMFLPGLEASRLYEIDSDGKEKMIWEPGMADNSELYLDSNGNPKIPNIYTRNVIDNAYVPLKGNVYKSFITSMDMMKSDGTINDWEAIPYDWRLSLDEILDNGVKDSNGHIYYYGDNASTSNPYIISELHRLASSSATGKVTIVAHSNGGLLTKVLTEKLGSDASKLIDQIIFVAVPQVGTPQAIGSLLHGFDEGLPMKFFPIFFSPTEMRKLGENMISAYNLLPSSSYFDYVSTPVITFDNSALLVNWREKYGNTINSGSGLYNFISDLSREVLPTINDLVSLPTLNKNLYDSAKELHDTKLDEWVLPEGVSLTEIAGWGEETLSGIEYTQGISTTCKNPGIFSTCTINLKTPILEYNPKTTFDGDGTVVVPSALWMATSTGMKKYWLNLQNYNIDNIFSAPLGRQHADILEVPELRLFIHNIILNSTSSLPKYISTSTLINNNLEKRLKFILHSPLSLDLYDEQGNHTGISTTTDELEENIPGSNYLTFGEVKYISVPASSTVYLAMRGYSSGSFTLNIQETQDNIVIASTTFAGIPSSTSTTATINIPDGNIASTSELIVDMNGDGNTDMNLAPKLNGIVFPDFPPAPIPNNNLVTQNSGGGGFSYPYYLPFEILQPTSTKLLSSSTVIKISVPIPAQKLIVKNNNNLSLILENVYTKNYNHVATDSVSFSQNKGQETAVVGNFQINAKILLVLSVLIIVIVLGIKFI